MGKRSARPRTHPSTEVNSCSTPPPPPLPPSSGAPNMMRLAAAALCLSTAALGAPPAGWKTCGGLPDNYTSTACDTATSTVRAARPHSGSHTPPPSRAAHSLAFGCLCRCSARRWTGSHLRANGAAARIPRPCSARVATLAARKARRARTQGAAIPWSATVLPQMMAAARRP